MTRSSTDGFGVFGRTLWLSALLLLGLIPLGMTAEMPTPVSAVLEDADGDFVPDKLGRKVTVEGVLTSNPLMVGRGNSLANLQDNSGGILLFTRDHSLFGNRFEAGDKVRVVGTVGQYLGAEQVILESITNEGRGVIPAPRPATSSEVNSEALAGRLVRISGRIRMVERPGEDGAQAEIVDSAGKVSVLLPTRFFEEPVFIEKLQNLHRAEIIGVVSQDDPEPPYDSGYRLVPRTVDDLKVFPAPPIQLIAISLSASVLAVASIILWVSRRRAMRVNEEMTQLTESLRQSQMRLREHQARLSLLTDQVPAIVWSVDRNLRFTSSIGAGLKALNLQQDAVVGLSLFEYFKTQDPEFPAIQSHLKAIKGEPGSFATMWGGRSYECNVVPLRSGAGDIVGAVGLALDTTDRRKVEQELEDQSMALRHAQKMEAVGRLAGGVAHDFNNLVTVIKGYCDLISLKLGAGHDLQDWFEEIKNSANRAASLTGQLLAFSRKQVLQPRVLDLNGVLSDMNRLLRRIIGEHIELHVELASDLGTVKVDKSQFEQVVMNLAVNAYDAMPRGGQLFIRTQDCVLTGGELGPAGQLPPGDYVKVSFGDTGEGMPPDVVSRVFEPFFTTKEVGKGTGLGLATVYGIVSQSGGAIDVESSMGIGTTFHIYLPVVGDAAEPNDPGLAADRNAGGSETVLLAEDEESVRSLMRRALEDKGYQVIEAVSGEEALHQSRSFTGRIDLLITDVVMPRMSGFKLARSLRLERPETKTLYVSGYAYTGRHEGEVISPETFLSKPFSPDMLALKVRRLLNSTSVTKN